MSHQRPTKPIPEHPRWLAGLVIAVGLTVLAGVILFATLQARQRIREQIADRTADVLNAVAQVYYNEDLRAGLVEDTLTAGDQLSIALKCSELRGVLGVRLFNPEGEFVESFPLNVIEENLPADYLPTLASLRPLSTFQPQAAMAALFYPDEALATNAIPLLEICVPLHGNKTTLAGVAQFLVEGSSTAAEFARLDRLLGLQAALTFGAGGTILSLALAWAFRRLRRAQRLLSERTENLALANQELALAAKTSALGAVAAHLIHGLKNPLSGLQQFVTSRGPNRESADADDWTLAVTSTRRMQAMIHQVIGVLREEQASSAYEVTLAELEGMVRQRVQPLARERHVDFTSLVPIEATLPNRVANLVALILVNLMENGIQATPADKSVTLALRRQDKRLIFEVRDEGPGFPADTPLFMPCRSGKEGGTGIGLALCKQLANHLGADLQLVASASTGCLFVLSLAESGLESARAPARLESEPTNLTGN